MAEFYVPKAGTIVLGGMPYRLIRGIHDISDALADSHEANDFGIKPVNEMTDDEWRMSGHVKAEWLRAHEFEATASASGESSDDMATKTKASK